MSGPVNGVPTGPPPPPAPVQEHFVGALYVQFMAVGNLVQPTMLGHVPPNAAEACATLLEQLARNLRHRSSRIVVP